MISFVFPLPSILPRRGDEDLKESTDTPIFLIQRRRLVSTSYDRFYWDSDDECLKDDDGEEITDQQLIDMECGEWVWDTIRVAFTRSEAQRFADAKRHWGVLRVYSVPCMGELRTIIKSLTNFEKTNKGNNNE